MYVHATALVKSLDPRGTFRTRLSPCTYVIDLSTIDLVALSQTISNHLFRYAPLLRTILSSGPASQFTFSVQILAIPLSSLCLAYIRLCPHERHPHLGSDLFSDTEVASCSL